MSVVAGASEMAGIVISAAGLGRSGGEDSGIRRALLSYIMAFPVALKVGVFWICFMNLSFCIVINRK